MTMEIVEFETLGDTHEPYDILDDESPAAFRAFAVYRDSGPDRTFKGTAEKLGVHPGSLKPWTGRHSWIDRARCYDTYLDRRARAVLERDIVASRQRHAEMARLIQDKVALGLAALEPRLMTPKDLIYALDVAVKLERAARGDLDAKRVELTGKDGGPIEVIGEMSAADRARMLAEIQSVAAARLGILDLHAEEIAEAELVEDDGADN